MIVDRILARLHKIKSVLEIGPGPGVLTEPLSRRFEIIAVELDRRMQPILADVAPDAHIVFEDVLESNLAQILGSLEQPVAVVSNMPYGITGPLLERITEVKDRFEVAILMMQREVGEKIMARQNDSARGSISVNMQIAFDIVMVCAVPASCFLPPPKVESIVLEFRPKHPAFYKPQIVRLGFTQPRKTLANNLKMHYEPALVQAALNSIDAAPNVRPHQLSNEQWISLSTML